MTLDDSMDNMAHEPRIVAFFFGGVWPMGPHDSQLHCSSIICPHRRQCATTDPKVKEQVHSQEDDNKLTSVLSSETEGSWSAWSACQGRGWDAFHGTFQISGKPSKPVGGSVPGLCHQSPTDGLGAQNVAALSY